MSAKNGPAQNPIQEMAEKWFAREMDRIRADPAIAQQRALDLIASETLCSELLNDIASLGILASSAQEKNPFEASLLMGQYLAYVRSRYLLQGPPFKIDKSKSNKA